MHRFPWSDPPYRVAVWGLYLRLLLFRPSPTTQCDPCKRRRRSQVLRQAPYPARISSHIFTLWRLRYSPPDFLHTYLCRVTHCIGVGFVFYFFAWKCCGSQPRALRTFLDSAFFPPWSPGLAVFPISLVI